jgi:hypothetical protein
MREFVIYSRGGYRVVPLIRGYIVKSLQGGEICPFAENDVDGAIDFVDELAAGVGEKVA